MSRPKIEIKEDSDSSNESIDELEIKPHLHILRNMHDLHKQHILHGGLISKDLMKTIKEGYAKVKDTKSFKKKFKDSKMKNSWIFFMKNNVFTDKQSPKEKEPSDNIAQIKKMIHNFTIMMEDEKKKLLKKEMHNTSVKLNDLINKIKENYKL